MGPYLSLPDTKKKFFIGENEKVKFYACEMQGWRKTMEDLTMIECLGEHFVVFGVFDGHGGKEVAQFVAKHFNEELASTRLFINGSYEQAMKQTFFRMDEMIRSPESIKEVLRMSRDLPEDHPVSGDLSSILAGCTAVIVLLAKNVLYIANAGDAKCIISRNSIAYELSTDHKPTLPKEQDRIYKAGGQIINNRVMGKLNFTRSIGDFEYKNNNSILPGEQIISANPSVKVEPLLGNEDFLILASDGVFDLISCQECVNFIQTHLSEGESGEVVIEKLLNHCLAEEITSHEGLGCDNMSIILVQFKGEFSQ